VHRRLRSQKLRNRHPESSFWETEAGSAWLRLLVFAVLYLFGLECGVGAGKLSRFFKLIRIHHHVGVSETALRTQMQQMELLLPQFQEACEQQVNQQKRKAVVAMDETFFGDFLILVLMDLSSGYLLMEDISDDRRFETWHAKTSPRLEALGIEVSHAISDRAKALIKLAVTGFECDSGADLFHAQQDLSRWLGSKLARHAATAEKQLIVAQVTEEKAPETVTTAERQALKEQSLNARKDCDQARQVQTTYHENLRGVSDAIHPFSLSDSSPNDAEKVAQGLETRAKAIEQLAGEQDISDHKDVMKKFRNQIQPLAVSVSFWWCWVSETVQGLAVDKDLEDWLTTTLLPVVYWHRQLHLTQNSQAREHYRKAWTQASHTLEAHPFSATLPDSDIQRWLTWAEWMVRQFHRSSSAVEGRNGCLAQLYHNGRGLTPQRLRALTVIHNYGLKHEDGSTAARRLFGNEHPELFSWLLEQMGALPLARKSRNRVVLNPLKLLNVPA
jgi:hypothetical protein